jgi:AraC family cel operon transcriptional repressor
LNSAVLDVFKYPNSGMALDRFLLNLFFEIESSSVLPFTKCPQWLQEAISKLNDPKVFQYGANSLAKLSGYSVEYVARTLKKCTGMTPSEVVNQARMEYAAALLATTSNDTYWIAEECGFESMSHFFSCFKRHFSCTPRTYRLNHQKLVIPQK